MDALSSNHGRIGTIQNNGTTNKNGSSKKRGIISNGTKGTTGRIVRCSCDAIHHLPSWWAGS